MKEETFYMGIKVENNRIVNCLAVAKIAKRIDTVSSKDFIVYKIGPLDNRRIKPEFYHPVGPLRLDFSPQIFEGITKKTPRVRQEEVGTSPTSDN